MFTTSTKRSLERAFRSGFVSLALIALLSASSASAAIRVWSGAGATDDWSVTGNWTGNTLPANGDDVIFGETDATAVLGSGGAPNNLVDALYGSALRSLLYTNTLGAHWTRINAARLTISGTTTTNVLYAGTGGDNGIDLQVVAAISGTSLVINNTNGTVQVRQTAANAGSHRATLDLSGLDNFSATVSIFGVARGTESGSTSPFNRAQGTLFLARTNTVTTTSDFVEGQANSNFGNGVAEIWLGQENTFNVGGALRFGYRKATAAMMFQTNLSNPFLKLRGGNGTARVSSWSIADNGSGDTGSNHNATNDFTGGRLDALVDTLYVGKTYSGETTGTGVSRGSLTFDGGVLDVNTMEVGQHTSANGGNAEGYVNVNGTAELRVNSMLRLGQKLGTRVPVSVVNVSGGALKVAGDIVDGGGTSTLNLTNGVVDLQPAGDPTPGILAVKNINWDSGTLTNYGGLYASEIMISSPTANLSLGPNALLGPAGKNVAGTMNVTGGAEFRLNSARWQVDLNDALGQSDLINLINMQPKLSGTTQVEINAPSGTLPNNTYYLLFFSNGGLVGGPANLAVYGPMNDSRHTFAFETTSYSINLNVGGADAANLMWSGDGTANLWQLKGAANWNSQTEKFYNMDIVSFDDTGMAAPPVQLDATLYPGAVTMNNNSKSYVFAGPGRISGTTALTLQGTGSLTLLTTNDYLGGTTINAGQLQLGDGLAADGGLGAGPITNLSSLVFASASSQLISNVMTGTGTVTKTGPGLTALAAQNTYSGLTVVTQGVLQTRSALALGTTNGATIITNGATLDFADQNLGLEPILVAGAGVSNAGALYESNPSSLVATAVRDVTLLGDTTFGGVGRWDLRAAATSDPGLRGNGYKLTKVGSGFVAIVGPSGGFWDTGLGDVEIQQGTLSFEQTCGLGVPTATLTIRSNASLQIYDNKATNTLVKNIVMDDTALITPSGPGAGTGTNVLGGTLTLNGTNRVGVANLSRLFVQGQIKGTGALNKQGNGTMYLSAANTYSGATLISSGGPLVLQPSGSVQSSSGIWLLGGVLDVSQISGGFTLASAQSIGGAGSVLGSVTVPATGSLIPGGPIGTLSFSNNLSLAGTAYFEINKTNALTNDLIAVTGTLGFGGKLVITNVGGPLSVGDKFTLFSKPGTGSFSSIEYPAGYTFTNKLALNGTIEVTGGTIPTTPTNLTYRVSGQTLTLSWPPSYLGWRLQVQSNPNSIGLSNNWQNVPGSEALTTTNIIMEPNGPSTFFRLVLP